MDETEEYIREQIQAELLKIEEDAKVHFLIHKPCRPDCKYCAYFKEQDAKS